MRFRYFHEIPDFIYLDPQTFLLWHIHGSRKILFFCFLVTFTCIFQKHCFLITDNGWPVENSVVSLSLIVTTFLAFGDCVYFS